MMLIIILQEGIRFDSCIITRGKNCIGGLDGNLYLFIISHTSHSVIMIRNFFIILISRQGKSNYYNLIPEKNFNKLLI